MKTSRIVLSCLPLLRSVCTRAQTQSTASVEVVEGSASSKSMSALELPDAPHPKPGANYRNRDLSRDSDWRAPFHLDETDRTSQLSGLRYSHLSGCRSLM